MKEQRQTLRSVANARVDTNFNTMFPTASLVGSKSSPAANDSLAFTQRPDVHPVGARP